MLEKKFTRNVDLYTKMSINVDFPDLSKKSDSSENVLLKKFKNLLFFKNAITSQLFL